MQKYSEKFNEKLIQRYKQPLSKPEKHFPEQKFKKGFYSKKNITILVFFILGVCLYYFLCKRNVGIPPSVECLASIISRCNPLWENNWLAGWLWHQCNEYCRYCKGSTYGICTSASLENCFDEDNLSTKCFCYGNQGNRLGNCWTS